MDTALALIPALPFAAFLLNILFGRRLKGFAAEVSLIAIGASAVLSLMFPKPPDHGKEVP